jgi:hypothetical protein
MNRLAAALPPPLAAAAGAAAARCLGRAAASAASRAAGMAPGAASCRKQLQQRNGNAARGNRGPKAIASPHGVGCGCVRSAWSKAAGRSSRRPAAPASSFEKTTCCKGQSWMKKSNAFAKKSGAREIIKLPDCGALAGSSWGSVQRGAPGQLATWKHERRKRLQCDRHAVR